MGKFVEANKKIENAVVKGYLAIETGVVAGYKAIEDGVVGGYKKIENSFVDTFSISREEVSAAEPANAQEEKPAESKANSSSQGEPLADSDRQEALV